MAHLHDVDKIKPDDERVQSRFVENGGHKWRMCEHLLFPPTIISKSNPSRDLKD